MNSFWKKSLIFFLFIFLFFLPFTTFAAPKYPEALTSDPDEKDPRSPITRIYENSPSLLNPDAGDQDWLTFIQRSDVYEVENIAAELKNVILTNPDVLEQANSLIGEDTFVQKLERIASYVTGQDLFLNPSENGNWGRRLSIGEGKAVSLQQFFNNLNNTADKKDGISRDWIDSSSFERIASDTDLVRFAGQRCDLKRKYQTTNCQGSIGDCEGPDPLESSADSNQILTDLDFCNSKVPSGLINFTDQKILDYLKTLSSTDQNRLFSIQQPKALKNCYFIWRLHPKNADQVGGLLGILLSIFSPSKLGVVEFACPVLGAHKSLETTAQFYNSDSINTDRYSKINSIISNKPSAPPYPSIVDGNCVPASEIRKSVNSGEIKASEAILFNLWNIRNKCSEIGTNPTNITSMGSAEANFKGSVTGTARFTIPNPSEVLAAAREDVYTVRAVIVAPENVDWTSLLAGDLEYGFYNSFISDADLINTNSKLALSSNNNHVLGTNTSRPNISLIQTVTLNANPSASHTICEEYDEEGVCIRSKTGTIGYSNTEQNWHPPGGWATKFLEDTVFGALRSFYDPEHNKCEDLQYHKFLRGLDPSLPAKLNFPDPGACDIAVTDPTTPPTDKPEINCNQDIPDSAIPDYAGWFKTNFIDKADRWIPNNQHHAAECYNDVVKRAIDAGINPLFALTIWLNESDASNYNVDPTPWEDFGIHSSSIPKEDFNAQITEFLRYTQDGFYQNYTWTKDCFNAGHTDMQAFMYSFHIGGDNCPEGLNYDYYQAIFGTTDTQTATEESPWYWVSNCTQIPTYPTDFVCTP